MSAGPSGPRGDSKSDAGTHDGAITNTSSGSPSVASSSQRTPSTPATLAISCGSQTTAVVPRGTTARANCAGVSLADSRCTWASMKPGHEELPAPVDPLAARVVADPGDPPVGEATSPSSHSRVNAEKTFAPSMTVSGCASPRATAIRLRSRLTARPCHPGARGRAPAPCPVAARNAATTAGVEEIVGGSPIPRRPYGESGSPSSRTSSLTGGMSSTVGIR